jgi:hypothetical protein
MKTAFSERLQKTETAIKLSGYYGNVLFIRNLEFFAEEYTTEKFLQVRIVRCGHFPLAAER